MYGRKGRFFIQILADKKFYEGSWEGKVKETLSLLSIDQMRELYRALDKPENYIKNKRNKTGGVRKNYWAWFNQRSFKDLFLAVFKEVKSMTS